MKGLHNILKALIFFKTLSGNIVFSCDYQPCKDNKIHSMCLYPESLDKSVPACSKEEATAGLTFLDKKVILDRHNEIRQRVAKGNGPTHPPAANMMKLYWNAELETIAQRFINACSKDMLYQDACRDLKDGTPVGQNIGSGNLQNNLNRTSVLDHIVIGWYNEAPLNISRITNYSPNVENQTETEEHTQMIWAETTMLGCGYRQENKESDLVHLVRVACNYAKGGNVVDAPIYITGEPCSKCPEGTSCSKRYPGLCTGEVDEYNDVGSSSSSIHFRSKNMLSDIFQNIFVSLFTSIVIFKFP